MDPEDDGEIEVVAQDDFSDMGDVEDSDMGVEELKQQDKVIRRIGDFTISVGFPDSIIQKCQVRIKIECPCVNELEFRS